MPGFGSGSLQVTKNAPPRAGASAPLKFPSRNEAFFNSLLASAYSIQHTQDLIRSSVSPARFNEVLGTVIDTRSLLRNPTLHLDTAMHLILSRAQKVSGASGAAICIAERGMIEYVAGTGVALELVGITFPESECAFFTRARTRPVIEWGELEEPKVRERIAVAFELRIPVCCGVTLVGCLKLYSRIRHFNLEIVYVCELMAAFLGQIIERQAPAVAQNVEQASYQPRIAANSGHEGPRMVYAPASATPRPGLRIEPTHNAKPINNELPSRTKAQTDVARPGGNGHFHGSPIENEEERLPTMDELLAELGAAIEEGTLLELAESRSEQPPPRDAPIPAKEVRELPVVVGETAEPVFPVARTIPPVPPVVADTNQAVKSRHTAIRKTLSNAAPFIFPTYVLIFCVSLNMTQTSAGVLFHALIFVSIIFSVIEIWRAGYGNR